jgi:hypothetical protein
MDKFKQLIKTFREREFAPLRGEEHLQSDMWSLFQKAAEECEIFVYQKRHDRSSDGPRRVLWEDTPVDAPFPVFSMEYESDQVFAGSDPRMQRPTHTECIMVQELPGDKRRYYVLVYFLQEKRYHVAVTENDKYYSPLVKIMLDLLDKGREGLVPANGKISIKTGKKKKKHILKERMFIVCGSKAGCRKYEKSGGLVEWNHSFNVRGHWRRIFCPECAGAGCPECGGSGRKKGFLGNDRNGCRVEPGRTWIRHSKRNEGKDPLKKVRNVLE